MSPKKIKKLADKKYREESGLFMVEGRKNIEELLASDFIIEEILGTRAFLGGILNHINLYDERMGTRIEVREMRRSELEEIGTFKTNETGIAIVIQKAQAPIDTVATLAQSNLILLLDDIRDPGNLGTIIRVADWFGVTQVVASPSTVDFYNPKVISATMGSFTRVSVIYAELEDFLVDVKKLSLPIVATVMNGANTHTTTLPKNGVLLMGSESHGVSERIQKLATHLVTIPRFGEAESLNVAIATGILLDSLRR